VSARREQLLEELVRECESAGGRALAVPADASNRADVEQLSKAAISQFGRVDVWVNNTGTGALGRFEEVPLEEHEQVIGDGPAGHPIWKLFRYAAVSAAGIGNTHQYCFGNRQGSHISRSTPRPSMASSV
jgi:short chain dehydrogenase